MLTGMRSSDGLDNRRRQALYRAWHRGMREMDMIFGPYANTHIADMSEADLTAFETLMSEQDTDLAKWFLGQAPVPAEVDTAMFRHVRDHLGKTVR